MATIPIRVWRQEALVRNKVAPPYTASTPTRVSGAPALCSASIITTGKRPQSNTHRPSEGPRRRVTRATVAGASSGIRLPNRAAPTACVRPRIINSASARMVYVLLVAVRVGQQCQITGALDGARQLTLILGFGTGNPARYNFASLANVRFQGFQIFIIDLLGTFGGEPAEFTTAEKTSHDYSPFSSSAT